MPVNNDISCLEVVSRYGYQGSGNCKIEELLEKVRNQMAEDHFAESTLKLQDRIFNRLRKCSDEMGVDEYTNELRTKFLDDNQYHRSTTQSGFSKSRYELHRRVIHRIDSYIAAGRVDHSPIRKNAAFMHSMKPEFIRAYNTYVTSISHLAPSTKDLYCRIVGYFVDFLDATKSYTSLNDIQKGDVDEFIRMITKMHFQNSLASVISGLRAFLDMDEFLLDPSFGFEIPASLRKHHTILRPLTTEEINQTYNYLDSSPDDTSLRNRAISEIALGTGNRSVDILSLTFSGLDLENDRLRFVQKKTGKLHEYPLTSSMGNSIVDYILYERPESQSQYIFLRSHAPYVPLKSHSECRLIIKKILKAAHIDLGERQVGTRLTRHSRATYLLNSGVPLPVIAQSIGHRGLNTVQVYLTADEERMAECILPVPVKKVVRHE